MTAAVPTSPTPPAPPLAPAERGSLRLADRVLAKIAAQAAREALADAPGGEYVPRGARQQAGVSVHREQVFVRLSVELGYPVDIASVCRSVRRHVIARVQELTGTAVLGVTVEVERLHSRAVHLAREAKVR
ncbi:Asp23/Gls24 family envelope stress response protein [Actinacidiphila sp. bgisy167]|uniref:Asp23/Gls24 family envelope stress response protein n=1 Tax=Actinacidiphila sp. bgisy167 TaxID=3413797 RepID=UPI003D7131C0